MIPGMYAVTPDGQTWQLLRQSGYAPNWAGMPREPVTWDFLNTQTGESLVLVDPTGDAFTLTPACDVCQTPPGYRACKALGYHQEIPA